MNSKIENPHKPGEFIDVPPLQDAIVMNVGDLMMRWSNGESHNFLNDNVCGDLTAHCVPRRLIEIDGPSRGIATKARPFYRRRTND